MTDEQVERLIAAAERVADNLAVLAFVTGTFDVGTSFGVDMRNTARDRACDALNVTSPAE